MSCPSRNIILQYISQIFLPDDQTWQEVAGAEEDGGLVEAEWHHVVVCPLGLEEGWVDSRMVAPEPLVHGGNKDSEAVEDEGWQYPKMLVDTESKTIKQAVTILTNMSTIFF